MTSLVLWPAEDEPVLMTEAEMSAPEAAVVPELVFARRARRALFAGPRLPRASELVMPSRTQLLLAENREKIRLAWEQEPNPESARLLSLCLQVLDGPGSALRRLRAILPILDRLLRTICSGMTGVVAAEAREVIIAYNPQLYPLQDFPARAPGTGRWTRWPVS